MSRDLAYRRPVDWILAGIGVVSSQYGRDFWHEVVIQPMFVPAGGWIPLGQRPGHASGLGERFRDFERPDEGAESMQRVTRLLEREGLPFLDQWGTLTGLTAWYDQRCREDATNPNWWEGAAGLAVLLHDAERVGAASAGIARAGGPSTALWVSEVKARTQVVLDAYHRDPDAAWRVLASRAEETRSELGLE